MNVALLVLWACCSQNALGYVISPPQPVPLTEPGIRYSPAAVRPAVKLEVFIDIHCSDSWAAWPIMKDLLAYYGSNQLDLVVQQLPMPFHRNVFLATQGIYLILDALPDQVFNYIEANFVNNANFSTQNTLDKSETQVVDMLADLAVASTGIDKTFFIDNLINFHSDTRTVWKYAIRRAVAATPTFWTNGVELGCGATIPTFDEFVTFLDPIINGQKE